MITFPGGRHGVRMILISAGKMNSRDFFTGNTILMYGSLSRGSGALCQIEADGRRNLFSELVTGE